MMVANLSFVYAQNSNFHIPKYEKMEGDTLVHYTGYSALYNKKYWVSRWTSYKLDKIRLNQLYIKETIPKKDMGIHFPDSMNDNPFLEDPFHTGHLVPFRHMNYSDESWFEVNYFSNLTPQNKKLNEGKWKTLENKTSVLAKKFDSVFIITGPIFNKKIKRTAFGVAIPDRYFKVILLKAGDRFYAIGFEFHNKKCSKKLIKYSKSISKIEKLTGLTFFNDLKISYLDELKKDDKFEFLKSILGKDLE